jgi:hypothetical protein
MSFLWCIPLVVGLTTSTPAPTTWRWYLALTGTNRWTILEGQGVVDISGESLRATLKDGSDTTRVRITLAGTVRNDSARVVVSLLGFDATPFPASGPLQRLCANGRGREVLLLVAEGGAIGLTRDVAC